MEDRGITIGTTLNWYWVLTMVSTKCSLCLSSSFLFDVVHLLKLPRKNNQWQLSHPLLAFNFSFIFECYQIRSPIINANLHVLPLFFTSRIRDSMDSWWEQWCIYLKKSSWTFLSILFLCWGGYLNCPGGSYMCILL
jgi:hypothetical protein